MLQRHPRGAERRGNLKSENTSLVLLVDGLVVFGLPDLHLIAIGYIVTDPTRDILGGRVKGKDLIEVPMVQSPFDFLLDASEIRHHPVRIELLGPTMHDDYPIMPVKGLALAFVTKVKAVGRRNL